MTSTAGVGSPYNREDYEANGFGLKRSPASPLAVVFVHGWNGDANGTWTWKPHWYRKAGQVCLPCLLAERSALNVDVYSFGHSAGPLSPAGIGQVAQSLRTFLNDRLPATQIALVSHSLGGLVCRRLILDCSTHDIALEQRILGLLMFGSPNLGTEMVKAAQSGSRVLGALWALRGAIAGSFVWRWLSGLLRRGSTGELRIFSTFLLELNQAWLEHFSQSLSGLRATPICEAVGGEKDLVVPYASAVAATPFGATYSLNKGHFGLVKARSERDETYIRTLKYIQRAEDLMSNRARDVAIGTLVASTRKVGEAIGSNWHHEESETIELSDSVPIGGGEGSVPLAYYECRISQEKKGLILPRTLLICASLSEHTAFLEPPTYHFIVGRGLLSERQQAQAAEFIDSDLAAFLIESIEAAVSRESVHYRLLEEVKTSDSTLMRFEAAEQFDVRSRETTLRIVMRGRAALDHGWWMYFNRSMVTQRLHLALTCPTRAVALFRHWSWGPTYSQGWGKDHRFYSSLEYKGPVYPGQSCFWVLGKGRWNGDQEEAQ